MAGTRFRCSALVRELAVVGARGLAAFGSQARDAHKESQHSNSAGSQFHAPDHRSTGNPFPSAPSRRADRTRVQLEAG